MHQGISPIYESELEEFNEEKHYGKLALLYKVVYGNTDVIYVAVEAPENEDGSASYRMSKKKH
nr:hypothetical protein [Anoxybacillus caldiproteolyticus]